MSQNGAYPASILAKLSSMMFEMMRLAEQIEAHERLRNHQTEPQISPGVFDAPNVVPFRHPNAPRRDRV